MLSTVLHILKAFPQGRNFNLTVRTPRGCIEFIENTQGEWFKTVAEMKNEGNMPYLIDRSLYSANTMMPELFLGINR